MSLPTSSSVTDLPRASNNSGERSRNLFSKDSPLNTLNNDDIYKKYQKTPQDASRLPARQTNPKPQQDIKKLLTSLPFTFQSKTTSSLDLKTNLTPLSTIEQTNPQTPDNSKDKTLTTQTQETNFKKSEEKKEPEQIDNDVLFDNFEKYFKIQFPSAKKDLPQSQCSPRKINKTLVFNEGEEISNDQALRRNQSRHDLTLKDEKPLVRGPSNYTSFQINTGRVETELSTQNQDHCPMVTNLSKNYSLHTARGRDEREKITQETSKYAQLAKERVKLNPLMPLPRLEKKEIRGTSRYNDFLFNNADTNVPYQIYDKDPVDTISSNKDFINDNWKVFEKTRERLGALHPDNNYRGANINTTINNNRTYVTNRIDKEDYGADTYVCANIERRRRNVSRRAGTDRLSEQLMTLKTDLDNKENIHTLKARVDYIPRYDRYSRDLSGVNQSIDDVKVTSKTLQGDQINGNLGYRETQDSFQENHRRASGRHALALRDITNQIKPSQDGISTRREYYAQAEKKINVDPNPYVPKPAYEILRMGEQQREKRRVSHMLLREEGVKRSTSAPRR